jgi:hypothetical protein
MLLSVIERGIAENARQWRWYIAPDEGTVPLLARDSGGVILLLFFDCELTTSIPEKRLRVRRATMLRWIAIAVFGICCVGIDVTSALSQDDLPDDGDSTAAAGQYKGGPGGPGGDANVYIAPGSTIIINPEGGAGGPGGNAYQQRGREVRSEDNGGSARDGNLEGTTVVYYRRSVDGTRVADALRGRNITYVERPPVLSEDLPTNGIACAPGTSIEAIREVAFALMDNGIKVRAIYELGQKTNTVYVLAVVDGYGQSIQSAPLSRSQIASLSECPPGGMKYALQNR